MWFAQRPSSALVRERELMRPRKVILLALADPQELSCMGFTLDTRGYRVLAVDNGDAAFDSFAANLVDLVLIDFHLPPTNGDQAAKRMKEIAPWTPVVMLRDRRPLGTDLFAADCLLDKTRTPTAELLERIRVMSQRKRGPRKGSEAAQRCGVRSERPVEEAGAVA